MICSSQKRVSPARTRHAWAVTAVIMVVGCGSPSENLVPVGGRITLDGQPMPRASISLRADGATSVGHQPTGMIKQPGEYVIYTNGRPGAPPGSYRVVVFATEEASTTQGAAPGLPKSLIPSAYNQPDATPLRLVVSPQASPASYNLELKSDPAP